MASPNPSDGPLSFLGITVRRSFTSGRLYFGYGMVLSTFLGLALAATGGPAFAQTYPLILPIFTVVGGMGALMAFSNDRLKGVLEYLMAYGVSPRQQFANTLLASLVLVSVVLGVSLSASLTFDLIRGGKISLELVGVLGIYGIPMSFAAEAFATTVGMFWTTLSSPRTGMSSPAGLAPFLGILPPVATLGGVALIGITYGTVSTSSFLLVAGLAVGLVALAVALLLAGTSRLLRPERLLSPA